MQKKILYETRFENFCHKNLTFRNWLHKHISSSPEKGLTHISVINIEK